MKKYWIIFPLFFYVLASSGLNITLHYCQDQLAGIALVYDASCCCDNSSEKDCCENQKVEVAKVDFDVLKNEEKASKSYPVSAVHGIHYHSEDLSQILSNDIDYLVGFKDPPKPSKLYLLLSRFVFYG